MFLGVCSLHAQTWSAPVLVENGGGAAVSSNANVNRGGHLRRTSRGEDGWRLENSGAAGIRQSGLRQWCLGRCGVHAVARGADLEQDIFLNCLQRGCRTRDSRGGGEATSERVDRVSSLARRGTLEIRPPDPAFGTEYSAQAHPRHGSRRDDEARLPRARRQNRIKLGICQ